MGKPPHLIRMWEAGTAYDTFDVKPLSKEVDEFINGEITRLHLKDSREVYEKVVKKYEKKLGIEESDIYTKLEKLAKYLRVEKKLLEGIAEREALEQADPLTLSADKLKQYLKMNHAPTV